MNGASNIGWNEAQPADSESAGLGDDRMRSILTSVRQGLDDEHQWSSAGGNAFGYHRFGSARPYFGTQSVVSSSGTDGRLMVASDSSRLFGVGSGGTVLLGAGPLSLSLGSAVAITFPQRAQWVEEVGYGATGSLGTTDITIWNSGYSGIPFVQLQLSQYAPAPSQLSANFVLSVQTVDGATFRVWAVAAATGNMAAGVNFLWRSLGTRTL